MRRHRSNAARAQRWSHNKGISEQLLRAVGIDFAATRVYSPGIMATLLKMVFFFATVSYGAELNLVQSTTGSVSQSGKYELSNNGRTHYWVDGSKTPNPTGDGYAYSDWKMDFDLSSIPPGSRITSAK
jgi:hypothetical protein